MVNKIALCLKRFRKPYFKDQRGNIRLMTPSLLIRPVLVCLAAASLAGCGVVDSDPHRFETMAENVAAIPLDRQSGPRVSTPVSPTMTGLRPALRVEVMEPHALWDARDGGLDKIAREAAPQMIAATAPAVADAVVQNFSAQVDAAFTKSGLRSTTPFPPRVSAKANSLVQIGAYSSEASARDAWARLQQGEAAVHLKGLTPVFQDVEIRGRRLTRLKVPVPASGAAVVCAAVGINDPWCHRTA